MRAQSLHLSSVENKRTRMKHLHQSLEHPDNDDAAKMHSCCCRDEHVEAGCGHYGEAEHPARTDEKTKQAR